MKPAAGARPISRLAGRALVVALLAASAPAQTPPAEPSRTAESIEIGASETTVWLAISDGEQSRLLRRTATTPFALAGSSHGRAAQAIPDRDDLFVFFADGAFSRFSGSEWQRELDLPGQHRPIDAVADAGAVFAVVPAASAAAMPAYDLDAQAASSQPFDPGSARLCLARYDGRAWAGLHTLPIAIHDSNLDARRQPRLLLAGSQRWLAVAARQPDQLQLVRLDARGQAQGDTSTLGIPGLRGFWITSVNQTPALLAAVSRGEAEQLVAYRLLEQPDRPPLWRITELELSIDAARIRRIEAAHGFNQQAVILLADAAGEARLEFGRFGGPPAESGVAVRDVVRSLSAATNSAYLLRSALMLVMLATMGTTFVLRRGSMFQSPALPRDREIAFTFQRSLGFLIDFVPLALLWAGLLHVEPSAAIRDLGTWATGGTSAAVLPDPRVLAWWGVTIASHSVYCLMAELIFGRTLGKWALRVELLSENGRPPTAGQVALRNLMRLVELLPMVWALGLLVILSRNRQRVGDLLSWTIVVRKIQVPQQGQDQP
ncbi:RDD family protein [Phycisphaerae bacterium RAS1]|nr:RDD family protein [Phycisphaerae bacterium RAS1]